MCQHRRKIGDNYGETCLDCGKQLSGFGYGGWFGIDINPERMGVDMAIKINMDAIRAANDRINRLDHRSVIWAAANPHRARGWLEAYMVRARAPDAKKLPKLGPVQGQ